MIVDLPAGLRRLRSDTLAGRAAVLQHPDAITVPYSKGSPSLDKAVCMQCCLDCTWQAGQRYFCYMHRRPPLAIQMGLLIAWRLHSPVVESSRSS